MTWSNSNKLIVMPFALLFKVLEEDDVSSVFLLKKSRSSGSSVSIGQLSVYVWHNGHIKPLHHANRNPCVMRLGIACCTTATVTLLSWQLAVFEVGVVSEYCIWLPGRLIVGLSGAPICIHLFRANHEVMELGSFRRLILLIFFHQLNHTYKCEHYWFS